jgi:hypothetical protein
MDINMLIAAEAVKFLGRDAHIGGGDEVSENDDDLFQAIKWR